MGIRHQNTPTVTQQYYGTIQKPRVSRGFRIEANDYITRFGVTFGDTQIAYIDSLPYAALRFIRWPSGAIKDTESYVVEENLGRTKSHILRTQIMSQGGKIVSQNRLDEIILEFIASEISSEIDRKLTGE